MRYSKKYLRKLEKCGSIRERIVYKLTHNSDGKLATDDYVGDEFDNRELFKETKYSDWTMDEKVWMMENDFLGDLPIAFAVCNVDIEFLTFIVNNFGDTFYESDILTNIAETDKVDDLMSMLNVVEKLFTVDDLIAKFEIEHLVHYCSKYDRPELLKAALMTCNTISHLSLWTLKFSDKCMDVINNRAKDKCVEYDEKIQKIKSQYEKDIEYVNSMKDLVLKEPTLGSENYEKLEIELNDKNFTTVKFPKIKKYTIIRRDDDSSDQPDDSAESDEEDSDIFYFKSADELKNYLEHCKDKKAIIKHFSNHPNYDADIYRVAANSDLITNPDDYQFIMRSAFIPSQMDIYGWRIKFVLSDNMKDEHLALFYYPIADLNCAQSLGLTMLQERTLIRVLATRDEKYDTSMMTFYEFNSNSLAYYLAIVGSFPEEAIMHILSHVIKWIDTEDIQEYLTHSFSATPKFIKACLEYCNDLIMRLNDDIEFYIRCKCNYMSTSHIERIICQIETLSSQTEKLENALAKTFA